MWWVMLRDVMSVDEAGSDTETGVRYQLPLTHAIGWLFLHLV